MRRRFAGDKEGKSFLTCNLLKGAGLVSEATMGSRKQQNVFAYNSYETVLHRVKKKKQKNLKPCPIVLIEISD